MSTETQETARRNLLESAKIIQEAAANLVSIAADAPPAALKQHLNTMDQHTENIEDDIRRIMEDIRITSQQQEADFNRTQRSSIRSAVPAQAAVEIFPPGHVQAPPMRQLPGPGSHWG
jgi:hypothetical protein